MLYSDYFKVAKKFNVNNTEFYADSLSDDLFDGYSPICRGGDGELYSVLFDFGGGAPRPVFWCKVAVNE
jgi:hypothetical protein